MRDQGLDDRRMPLRGRPHKRRLAAGPPQFQVGAGTGEPIDDVRGARARRHHHRGLAREQRKVGVGARRQQQIGHSGVAILPRRPERRRTEIVRPVGIRPSLEQQLDGVVAVAMDGPEQCGRSVRFRRAGVGPDGTGVALLRRGHQGCGGGTGGIVVRLGGRRTGGNERDDGRDPPRADPHRAAPYRSARVSSGSLPVLPPIRSTGTSILSISVTSRFASDGSLA